MKQQSPPSRIPSGSQGIVYSRSATRTPEAASSMHRQVASLADAVRAAGATYEVVTDLGASGLSLERRFGLQGILARALQSEPGFAWVLVSSVSRLSRSIDDALAYRATLAGCGIELLVHPDSTAIGLEPAGICLLAEELQTPIQQTRRPSGLRR